MATVPSFIDTPRINSVNVATANSALDGTGTVTELVAGATTGTRVLEIVAQAAATSQAGLVNIFLTTNGGSTWRLFDSITIAAKTVSDSASAQRATATYTNLVLPSSNARLGVTTTITQSINVMAFSGDL